MRPNDGGVIVAVVGDRQVGKSSLILSLVSGGTFTAKTIPGVVQPLVLPPEATREKTPLSVIDTSALPSRSKETEEFLRVADAIVLAVTPKILSSLERVSSHWLPLFERLNLHAPVIVAINLFSDEEANHDKFFSSVDIEARVTCNAATAEGVQKVFFAAQTAGLSPSKPLLDQKQQCSVLFSKALHRIFAVSSANKQVMTDAELSAFHEICFGTKLSPEITSDLKKLVKASGSIKVEEFEALHMHMLRARRPESVWQVLSTFHYDRTLQLDPRFFTPPRSTPRGLELSSEAVQFLTATFHSYASLSASSSTTISSIPPNSPVLTVENFAKIFANSPQSDLFGSELFDVICYHATGSCEGQLALSGWLAYFAMFAFCCPTQLSLLLGYMGFLQQQNRVTMLRPRPPLSHARFARAPPQQVIAVTVYGHNPTFSLKVVRDYLGFEDMSATSSATSLFPSTPPRPALSEIYAHQVSVNPLSFLVLSFAAATSSSADVTCLVHDGSARSNTFIRKLLLTLSGPVVVLSDSKKASAIVWPGTDLQVFVQPFNDSIASVLYDTGVRHRHELASTTAIMKKRIWSGVGTTACASFVALCLYYSMRFFGMPIKSLLPRWVGDASKSIFAVAKPTFVN